MKTGIPPGFSERQTPTRGTRTHKAENLPSVSSALKRGGDAGLFAAPPTAILSAPLTCMPSVLLFYSNFQRERMLIKYLIFDACATKQQAGNANTDP